MQDGVSASNDNPRTAVAASSRVQTCTYTNSFLVYKLFSIVTTREDVSCVVGVRAMELEHTMSTAVFFANSPDLCKQRTIAYRCRMTSRGYFYQCSKTYTGQMTGGEHRKCAGGRG